jgi:hypothetical protein
MTVDLGVDGGRRHRRDRGGERRPGGDGGRHGADLGVGRGAAEAGLGGLEALDQPIHRRLRRREERPGQEAHHHDEGDHRGEDEALAHGQVGEVAVVLVRDLPEEDPLDEEEHVDRAEDHAGRGDRREDPGVLHPRQPGAGEDEELADEAVRAGEADRGERHDHEDRGDHRDLLGEAAVLRHEPGVPALVEDADEEEEGARRDAVVQHLVDAAGEPLRRDREEAEHHEAEVRDGRVGDEPLHVALHERHQGAVHDPDHRHDREEGPVLEGRLGEERHRVAEEAEGAHLEEHAGEDDRPGGGRLGVGVGQPGVEREHRDLHREGEGEGEEQVAGRVRGDLQRPARLEVVEGPAVVEVDVQDGEQHEDARREGVDEELHRRVQPVLRAPHADEEIHRHEDELPEHIEEHEVEGREGPDHRRLEDEQRDHELLHAVLDGRPGREHHDGRERRREHHEQQRHAVEADVVAHPDRADPGDELLELELGGAGGGVEPEPQAEGDEEGDERDREGERLVLARLGPRDEHQGEGAQGRDEGDDGEQVHG